jgi:hypothetical protein
MEYFVYCLMQENSKEEVKSQGSLITQEFRRKCIG